MTKGFVEVPAFLPADGLTLLLDWTTPLLCSSLITRDSSLL
jgi:hypothetical protein